jgi:hypothetical protein
VGDLSNSWAERGSSRFTGHCPASCQGGNISDPNMDGGADRRSKHMIATEWDGQ